MMSPLSSEYSILLAECIVIVSVEIKLYTCVCTVAGLRNVYTA